MPRKKKAPQSTWHDNLYKFVHESDTVGGQVFDGFIFLIILVSVTLVALGTVPNLSPWTLAIFNHIELWLTAIFTLEYGLRIIASKQPGRYIKSGFGVIDLLAILPTYVGLFIVGAQALVLIRVLRLLRVVRIFKLLEHADDAKHLVKALQASKRKITVFLLFVAVLMVIVGTLMYVVEGGKNGFVSIPESIYWAVVTLSTVGYGDIVPMTALGKSLASVVMLMGYGIIAVPTGIVSAEFIDAKKQGRRETRRKKK